ncbi:MAG: hypothetical protein NT144_11010 [Bacteroidia bacterium]|nr:hypothetical protein [Bacteroidia bacterium]
MKNPSDLLKRVYDILINTHIIISSPESKYENDDVIFYNSLLKIINAKIAKD